MVNEVISREAKQPRAAKVKKAGAALTMVVAGVVGAACGNTQAAPKVSSAAVTPRQDSAPKTKDVPSTTTTEPLPTSNGVVTDLCILGERAPTLQAAVEQAIDYPSAPQSGEAVPCSIATDSNRSFYTDDISQVQWGRDSVQPTSFSNEGAVSNPDVEVTIRPTSDISYGCGPSSGLTTVGGYNANICATNTSTPVEDVTVGDNYLEVIVSNVNATPSQNLASLNSITQLIVENAFVS